MTKECLKIPWWMIRLMTAQTWNTVMPMEAPALMTVMPLWNPTIGMVVVGMKLQFAQRKTKWHSKVIHPKKAKSKKSKQRKRK